MSLIERIDGELKAARLARDGERRDALSLVLNALQAAQKELNRALRRGGAAGAPARAQAPARGCGGVPQGRARGAGGGRGVRARGARGVLPGFLSEEELEEIIDDVISEVGATSIRDMGRVMAGVMHQVSAARTA